MLWTVRERAIRVLGIEPANSLDWLESTAPTEISDDAGEDAADRRSRLADAVDELDGILLTAIEEIAKAEEQEMTPARAEEDRKSVVQGKSVSVRVDLGGRRSSKTKNNNKQ